MPTTLPPRAFCSPGHLLGGQEDRVAGVAERLDQAPIAP